MDSPLHTQLLKDSNRRILLSSEDEEEARWDEVATPSECVVSRTSPSFSSTPEELGHDEAEGRLPSCSITPPQTPGEPHSPPPQSVTPSQAIKR